MAWIDSAGAHLIYKGPSHVHDGNTDWEDLRGADGSLLTQTIKFIIEVENDALETEHRSVVVSGEGKSDGGFVIGLQRTRGSEFLCRLCTASHHDNGTPHWHWHEDAVKGAGWEEPVQSLPSLPSRYDLLEHFRDRLNITGVTIKEQLL